MISRDKIAGSWLWYERGEFPDCQSFDFDSKFYRTLEEGFLEIAEAFKPLSRVITAGAYVDKPGAHNLGRAFDLDGIEFEDGQLWMATETGKLTAAIQGVFMKRFGVVLGWTYDEAHEDHLHISDYGPAWGFRESRSITKYIQWGLGLGGNPLKMDGVWGSQTGSAFWQHLGRRDYEAKHHPTNADYRTFLDFAVQRFFSQMKRKHNIFENALIDPAFDDPKILALEKIRDIAATALQDGDLSE